MEENSSKPQETPPPDEEAQERHPGDVVQRVSRDLLMAELHWRDVAQIVVGACVLCIPVSYTEEVWVLSEQLPARKAVFVALFSLTFVALFVYLNFYRRNMKANAWKFVGRVAATYFITGTVAAFLLFSIDKLPLVLDTATAVKRVILVAFPGCFSATVIDSLK